MKIAIASGKGGTGKTLVAVNLALTAARAGRTVRLGDCDVEEPNDHLFLSPEIESTREVKVPVPILDPELCNHCGECASFCEFNAIACLPNSTMIFDDLCHSCGGCWQICPTGALNPGERVVGELDRGRTADIAFSQGRLRVGETLVPPLIREVKDSADDETWVLLDAPPGVTCPVVETLQDADYAVLVTEPTPFGLHDLKLAVELVRGLGVSCGVVINRADVLDHGVEDYCKEERLPVLARIPFRRSIAETCATGGLAIDADEEAAAAFRDLFTALQWCEVAS